MPPTMIGLIYYENDPEKKIFRKVYPTVDDSELDDPSHLTVGVDATRKTIMIRVPYNSAEADAPMTGTP